ncbi:hypothetical protein DFH07DRAFT_942066 [Mycena maculata]|uniref:Uncharacterized protein n=1 Tax=Mycena maculata TaxID=230809 RepID=A0AAD7N819_9AGAR|nr:hypothetical protein DFH07DRAFT_942066 [Mycena maculata]
MHRYPPPIIAQASQSDVSGHATSTGSGFGDLALPTLSPQVPAPPPSTTPKSLAQMCPNLALPGSASRSFGHGGTFRIQPTVPTPSGASITTQPPTILPQHTPRRRGSTTTQCPSRDLRRKTLVDQAQKAALTTPVPTPASQSPQAGEGASIPPPKDKGKAARDKGKQPEAEATIRAGTDKWPQPQAPPPVQPPHQGQASPPVASGSRSRKRRLDDREAIVEVTVPRRRRRTRKDIGMSVLRFQLDTSATGVGRVPAPPPQRFIPPPPPANIAFHRPAHHQDAAHHQPQQSLPLGPMQQPDMVPPRRGPLVSYQGQLYRFPERLYQVPPNGGPLTTPEAAARVATSGVVVLDHPLHFGPAKLRLEYFPNTCYRVQWLTGAYLVELRQKEGPLFFGNEFYDPATNQSWVMRILEVVDVPALPSSVEVPNADSHGAQDRAPYQPNAGPSAQVAYPDTQGAQIPAFYQTDINPMPASAVPMSSYTDGEDARVPPLFYQIDGGAITSMGRRAQTYEQSYTTAQASCANDHTNGAENHSNFYEEPSLEELPFPFASAPDISEVYDPAPRYIAESDAASALPFANVDEFGNVLKENGVSQQQAFNLYTGYQDHGSWQTTTY